jgi:hypothetical protein
MLFIAEEGKARLNSTAGNDAIRAFFNNDCPGQDVTVAEIQKQGTDAA